jgi:hypothetical protein
MSQANQVVDFIARLCLVLLFPFSALDKIFNHESAMAQAGHGLIALPHRSPYCCWCSAASSRCSARCAFCSIFIAARRRCCSCST